MNKKILKINKITNKTDQMDECLKKVINSISSMFHINAKESIIDTISQFIKFGVVGLTNTLLSYLINVMTLLTLEKYNLKWDYIFANVLAFLLSVLWSFYWNNKFVFKKKDDVNRNMWATLLKTYIAYGFTGIILTNALSFVWVNLCGLSKYIAPIINLILSVPLNFIINKKWSYKA